MATAPGNFTVSGRFTLQRYARQARYNLLRTTCYDFAGNYNEQGGDLFELENTFVQQVGVDDTVGPVVAQAEASPDVVNVTARAVSFLFTALATDNLSGVQSCTALLRPSVTEGSSFTLFQRLSLADVQNGVHIFTADFEMPALAPPGDYEASVSCYDAAGNFLESAVPLFSLSVASPGDAVAPNVVSAEWSPLVFGNEPRSYNIDAKVGFASWPEVTPPGLVSFNPSRPFLHFYRPHPALCPLNTPSFLPPPPPSPIPRPRSL